MRLQPIPGHQLRVEPTASGKRFVAKCTCGYLSTTRGFESLAVEAAVHHLRLLNRAYRSNGVDPASTTSANDGANLAAGT